MERSVGIINNLIVEVFNDILFIEETSLREGYFKDLSVTEVHTIEAIGMYQKKSATEVAKKLNITAGTLSVAINNLVKKGYAFRDKSEEDRRVVNLTLTKKGRLLYRVHQKFHTDMIKEAVSQLDIEERDVLTTALSNIHAYLLKKYNEIRK